jgi:hypothetical protein
VPVKRAAEQGGQNQAAVASGVDAVFGGENVFLTSAASISSNAFCAAVVKARSSVIRPLPLYASGHPVLNLAF